MSLTDDNEGPADRIFKRPAPRIDTMRNQLAGTRTLLESVETELEDLHVLGYERQAAAQDRAHVKGGTRDFALDEHGDKRARDAYRQLADVVLGSVEDIAEAAHGALRFLRVSGAGVRRTPRQLDALELADQIANQAQRIGRGDEYTPVRRHPQPDANAALVGVRNLSVRLGQELERARETVRQLEEEWPVEDHDKPIPAKLRASVDAVLGREEAPVERRPKRGWRH